MKLEDFRTERRATRTRVSASVIWEDCDRTNFELYFETENEFGQDLSCNPHAMLIACLIPAMHYGEERVFIDAEICPELRLGLGRALFILQSWFYASERKMIRIESKLSATNPIPETPDRAGLFFSGGIDSFASLWANRLHFPPGHPRFIKDGLLVFGLEQDSQEIFEHVVRSFSSVAPKAGITLIPVYTNLYLHYRQDDARNHFDFWIYKFQGAALAAVAHAFTARLSVVSIAATFDIASLGRWGSHPLLDPNYSSSDMRILHDGIEWSRFAKTEFVADWDVALQNLRVCNQYKRYQPNKLNCGHCEKCVRTMLALLALGVLGETQAFSQKEMSEDLVLSAATIHDDYVESCYRQLLTPLTARGHQDLVRAIERRIAIYRRGESGWKTKIKRFDTTYLNGNLARLKNGYLPNTQGVNRRKFLSGM